MKETAISLGMQHEYLNWGESCWLNLTKSKTLYVCKGRREDNWETIYTYEYEDTRELEEVTLNYNTTENWLIRFVELMKESVKNEE